MERVCTLPREDRRGLQHEWGSPVLLIGSVRWSDSGFIHA